jgi:tetratricopeptide (TPR) repeat protein
MVRCQNCTSANPVAREFCGKCGTRLLVTSRTASSEASIASMALPMAFMDEHVLERVSALEGAVTALGQQVSALTDAVERVSASNFIDHTMIETLTDTIESAGVNLANLEGEWRKRIDVRLRESDAVERLGNRIDRIVEFYDGTERKQFTMWIERGYEHLVSGRPADGARALRSAYTGDPANYHLGMLLVEIAFRAGDWPEAERSLQEVLTARPDHFEAVLLMGDLERSRGHDERAAELLRRALDLREDSPSAHAALGSVLLSQGDGQTAKRHLSRALELKPSAPMHFMLGAVFYHGGHHRRAIEQLRQATELDPEFGEAFYQLGLLCLEMNWIRKARECLKRAQGLDPAEPRYRRRVRGFSEPTVTTGPLRGLVRDELRWNTGWGPDKGMDAVSDAGLDTAPDPAGDERGSGYDAAAAGARTRSKP